MPSKTEKRMKQLRVRAKKRAQRPTTTFTPRTLAVTANVERRLIRDHADVLQNIEAALVSAAQQVDDIDDYVIEQALRHVILDRPCDDPSVLALIEVLVGIREVRNDVEDDLWLNALRVVHQSVKRHSECEPDEFSYLDFVASFIR